MSGYKIIETGDVDKEHAIGNSAKWITTVVQFSKSYNLKSPIVLFSIRNLMIDNTNLFDHTPFAYIGRIYDDHDGFQFNINFGEIVTYTTSITYSLYYCLIDKI